MTICLSLVVIMGFVDPDHLAPMARQDVGLRRGRAVGQPRWPFPLPILAGALAAAIVGVVIMVRPCGSAASACCDRHAGFGLAMDRFVFDNPTINGGLEEHRRPAA